MQRNPIACDVQSWSRDSYTHLVVRCVLDPVFGGVFFGVLDCGGSLVAAELLFYDVGDITSMA